MDADRGILVRRPLDWDLEPQDVLRMLRADAHPVALLGSWAAGSDLVASEPTLTRCPPQSLQDVLDEPLPDLPGSGEPGSQGFGGGWIGYLGFGLTEEMLPAPPAPGGPRVLPAWWFGFYDHVLRRDRTTGSWTFEALWTPERADALDHRFVALNARVSAGDIAAHDFSCGDFTQSPSAQEHRSAVRSAIDRIGSGDIFQANICLRLEAEFSGDPLDAFCQASAQLRPPFAAFLRTPDGAVASLSPELFLRRVGRTVLTRPIKGTRHRPAEAGDAARERELLLRSAKDRAENVMIVDLMRNDLSRVCVAGSVLVPRLLAAEAHPGVWHLVSDVEGVLAQDTTDHELLAATFPPGSVTGAPKVRAVEVIHELETMPREIYTGAIGYRSPVAGLELNVAIRTFEFQGGRVWLGSGGGITVRSDADDEYRECLVKAAPLVAALGARLAEPVAGTARLEVSAEPAVSGVPEAMRPRPAFGVFTSLALCAAGVLDLDRHLARLDVSTWRLYGKHLPTSVRTQVLRTVGGRTAGRLRISARPLGGPLQVRVEIVPIAPRPATVSLHPVTVPGGLGADKWQDRRLLAALATGADPSSQLLIQDADGEILETDRASVFAVIDGGLHTPPTDGRLLPGLTRAAVLALAGPAGIRTAEAPLTVLDLARASEVFVTNAVYGVTPVGSLAGTGLVWPAGPVAAHLTALLGDPAAGGVPAVVVPDVPAPRPSVSGPHRGRRGGRPLVVLIDNYDSFTYNLAHLLLTHRCKVEVIHNDELPAVAVAAFAPDGIVVSPGPCTPAEAGISIDTIRLCGATTPLLGVCLGHQAIAAAYGGRVVRAPQPRHGEASAISHDGLGILRGLPQDFLAARYHSLVVADDGLPAALTITARTAAGLPMGLRHRAYPVEGVQFHPESILTTHGGAIVRNFTRAMQRRLEHQDALAL